MTKEIGVDIEEVGRFRKLPYKNNISFYKKTFTANEIKYCNSRADPAQHFAARFAAKEAVAKALGKSVYNAKEIEILNDKYGKPEIRIRNPRTRASTVRGRQESGIKVLVSLSHTKEYAVAFVIWLS